jgi:hypothetical protein
VRYPYKSYPNGRGGIDQCAVLNVQIARDGRNTPRSKRFEAVIDSGASLCLFHASIGRAVGIDIEAGLVDNAMGISGQASSMYLHEIQLYLPGGPVTVRAGFSESLPLAGLLGMEGFFDKFKVTFDPVARECDLERIHQS